MTPVKMKQYNTQITSKSIDQSGLPTDYKKAIAEYIWNGFDAGATCINLQFTSNSLGYLNEFKISDNGSGINLNHIESTFGHFLDSHKNNSFNKDGFVKGKKGKGRYSFSLFCNKAVWKTTYKNSDTEYLGYSIEIEKNSLNKFNTFDNIISKSTSTGTTVYFYDFFDFSAYHLNHEDFSNFLASEFGWFLFLNKEEAYSIIINDTILNYESVISEHEVFSVTIGDYDFKINFLRWNQKIGDKYFYYFLNDEKKEAERKHTSFNNKAIDFHHSVYIISDYFNDFQFTETDDAIISFLGKNQSDGIFKSLLRDLNRYVLNKEKEFIRTQQAGKLIEEYHRKNIFPKFRDNEYDRLRRTDLENVIKEIYCVQPRIFHGLKQEASKTLVGFLNLLLDSEEREKILDIMEGIVALSNEERTELSESLRRTKISSIAAIIRMLENRLLVVKVLKTLVYELEKFTNERDHIQKVIENNYWLFGEQFHLVSADKNIEVVLNNYLSFLEKGEEIPEVVDNINKLKRPDVFICRQIDVPDAISNEYTIEENIIVELKRPSVIIGKKQFSQIEDYMRIIIDDSRFNSQLRRWKFILVGKSVDAFIEDKYESQKNKGKKFLVEAVRNYEIFAMTWDDLFKLFDHRHKHLINKLEFKDSVIEELAEKGFELNKETSNQITKLAIDNTDN